MITCPTCSFENEDSDEHCGRCGRPLGDISAAAPEADADAPKDSDPEVSEDATTERETLEEGPGEPSSSPMTHRATQLELSRVSLSSDKIPIRTAALSGKLDPSPGASSSPQRSDEDTDLEDPWLTRKIQDAIQRSGDETSSPIEDALQNASRLQLRVRQDASASGRQPRNTLVEGLPAVKKELLAAAAAAAADKPDDPASDPPEASAEEEDDDPRATVTLEALQRQTSAPITDDELKPVTTARSETAPLPATPPTPPPSTNPFNTFVPGMLVGILIGILVTGIGAGVLIRAQNVLDPEGGEEATNEEAGEDTPTRLTIPSGPFLRGLSNDYRLMFAELCKKTAKEPDTECKEEIALKGEYPQKTIELEAFDIDTHEVTNADWEACEEAKGCARINYAKCSNWTVQGLKPFGRVSNKLKRPDRPVVCVTRDEAAAYCAWAKGALPTQDQWEKAARGKDAYLFPWGTNWAPALANWAERDVMRAPITGELDGEELPAPAGRYPKGTSPFGVMDMAGNVYEWVQPDEGDDANTATARGGSWVSSPLELRTTHRLSATTSTRRSDVGLRCAYPAP